MSSVEKLKEDVFKAVQEGDLASLYMLEEQAYNAFEEDMLQDFYANILDMALERLTDTLEAHRVMDMNEVQDFATLRALYEYAMENYSAGKTEDASALFEVLSGLSNNKEFSKALKIHWLAAAKKISLDDFLENVADVEATQEAGTFYISSFYEKEAQKLLENAKSSGE